ncbi:MAG: TilS substrate-binding domain-containing protein, partial [Pseudonocardiaceae bacterium]
FRRVRLRSEVLPLLEEVLDGGVSAALARTATQLREDLDMLDELADALLASARCVPGVDVPGVDVPGLGVTALRSAPAPLRRRALRRWLLDAGVAELTDPQLRAVDGLVGCWRGQGGVAVPGGFVVGRAHGRLHIDRAPATS